MPAPWNAHAVARLKGSLHGQQTINVMHFGTNAALGGGADVTLLIALAVAILQCVETVLLPAVTQDWTCEGVDTQYVGTVIPNVTTDPYQQGPAGPGVGLLGTTSVSFAATLVRLNSGVAGRRGRGHWFLPPPGEAQIAASTIDDPTLDLMIAFLNCMIGKFVGVSATTDFRLGVWSKKTQGTGGFGSFDAAFHEVKNMQVINKLAVIARRRVGHGR